MSLLSRNYLPWHSVSISKAMSIPQQFTDSDLEIQFKNCTLDPKAFNHEAHLRLAWIHINRYGLDNAIKNLCVQIQQYATKLGMPDKYNETLTIAAIKAVNHFKLRSNTSDFQSFITENHRLKYNFKELLSHHYLTDIFTSESAKKKFLEPDLLPFD